MRDQGHAWVPSAFLSKAKSSVKMKLTGLLSTHCKPGTVKGPGLIAVNTNGMVPALMELTGSFGQKGRESKAPTIKLGTGIETAEEGG